MAIPFAYIWVRQFSLALGVLSALLTLAVGTVGIVAPGYGDVWLDMLASLYPGYANDGSFMDVLVGTGYAFVGGAVTGWLLANLYNRQGVTLPDGRVKSFWAIDHKHDGVPDFWTVHKSGGEFDGKK